MGVSVLSGGHRLWHYQSWIPRPETGAALGSGEYCGLWGRSGEGDHLVRSNVDPLPETGANKRLIILYRGESAGGASVGTHLVAYGGRDDKLFRAAISESGYSSAFTGYPTVAQWQPIYDYIIQETNCTGAADTLACLRTIPTDALSTVFNSTFNGSNIGSDSNFSPQIDGDFLQASGTTQEKKGQFVQVPYLLGSNFDEGTSFATTGINTTAEFVADLRARTPTLDNQTIATLLALYPDIPALGIPATLTGGRPAGAFAAYGRQWKRAAAYAGDYKMQAGRRLAAQARARHHVPAYTYHFNVLVHGATAAEGAGHYREVAFVFADTAGLGYHNAVAEDPFADEPGTFGQLAEMMSRMWVSFITELDPNHSGGTFGTPPPFFPLPPSPFPPSLTLLYTFHLFEEGGGQNRPGRLCWQRNFRC